jgi:hypothetical protein
MRSESEEEASEASEYEFQEKPKPKKAPAKVKEVANKGKGKRAPAKIDGDVDWARKKLRDGQDGRPGSLTVLLSKITAVREQVRRWRDGTGGIG